jgi:hypothetical protein
MDAKIDTTRIPNSVSCLSYILYNEGYPNKFLEKTYNTRIILINQSLFAETVCAIPWFSGKGNLP